MHRPDTGPATGRWATADCTHRLFVCSQNAISLCSLGVGSTFGESILNPLPRDTTVVTRTTCELLRVERRDFKAIWEVSAARAHRGVSERHDHCARLTWLSPVPPR